MSIAERRTELATALTEALAAHDITVDPYQAPSPAPFAGWLQVGQTDTEGCPFAGWVRLSVEMQVLVAVDRGDFERIQDQLTVPLIDAIHAAGGNSVVVQPYREVIDNTTLYALSAKFYTESGVA